MSLATDVIPLNDDEPEKLAHWVPLVGQDIIVRHCGIAALRRSRRYDEPALTLATS